ncbi:MAG: sulfite exporter TauE/SafE family protein [Syntrophobacteraceae bacterium]
MALSYLSLAALGMAISSCVTLIGAGGGILLMPLLFLLFQHENPQELTAISSACLLIHTASSTLAYTRLKRVDYSAGLFYGAAGLQGAVLGVIATGAFSRQFFEFLFALFLIALSLFLTLKWRYEARSRKIALPSYKFSWSLRKSVLAHGIIFEYDYKRLAGLSIFFLLGFLTAFLGIGGTSLIVLVLLYVVKFPIFIATGTAQLIAAIVTLTATLTHMGIGSFGHGGLHRLVAIGVGMMAGAQMGTHFSGRIKRAWVVRSLVAVFALVGLRVVLAIL